MGSGEWLIEEHAERSCLGFADGNIRRLRGIQEGPDTPHTDGLGACLVETEGGLRCLTVPVSERGRGRKKNKKWPRGVVISSRLTKAPSDCLVLAVRGPSDRLAVLQSALWNASFHPDPRPPLRPARPTG